MMGTILSRFKKKKDTKAVLESLEDEKMYIKKITTEILPINYCKIVIHSAFIYGFIYILFYFGIISIELIKNNHIVAVFGPYPIIALYYYKCYVWYHNRKIVTNKNKLIELKSVKKKLRDEEIMYIENIASKISLNYYKIVFRSALMYGFTYILFYFGIIPYEWFKNNYIKAVFAAYPIIALYYYKFYVWYYNLKIVTNKKKLIELKSIKKKLLDEEIMYIENMALSIVPINYYKIVFHSALMYGFTYILFYFGIIPYEWFKNIYIKAVFSAYPIMALSYYKFDVWYHNRKLVIYQKKLIELKSVKKILLDEEIMFIKNMASNASIINYFKIVIHSAFIYGYIYILFYFGIISIELIKNNHIMAVFGPYLNIALYYYTFNVWYHNRKIETYEKRLLELKSVKEKLLDVVMEKETFNVAKEILEIYAPHRLQFMTSQNFINLREVLSTSNRPPYASYGRPLVRALDMGHPPSIMLSTLKPRLALPMPVLSRDRTTFDRLADGVLGDGLQNRHALICRTCGPHNGMACKEEFDLVDSKGTEDIETDSDRKQDQESEMPVASTFHCTFPGCARQFKSEVWCSRHVDKHFQNNVCPTCNKKVYSKSSLARHIQLHKDKRNTYTCVTCNSKFYYKSDLNYHVKTVHNEKNLYKCSICDKEYSTKKLLNNHHQAVHLKLKKYRCPECGLFFGQPIELYRHRKKNHVVEIL